MADKEKVYIVLEGQKYSGKHKVYTEGQKFAESEIFGDLDMAVKGSKDHNIDPKIKEWKASTGKKKSDKKDDTDNKKADNK